MAKRGPKPRPERELLKTWTYQATPEQEEAIREAFGLDGCDKAMTTWKGERLYQVARRIISRRKR